MKKQKGFTLIELMVVMAIIAILATAGLSAYTGYIKKARDATRIADLAAINTIVLASMSATGLPPLATDIIDLIKAANNGQLIKDPLPSSAPSCYVDNLGVELKEACTYWYYLCDGGMGYTITALFESPSNLSLYTQNQSGPWPGADYYYDVGNCMEDDSGAGDYITLE